MDFYSDALGEAFSPEQSSQEDAAAILSCLPEATPVGFSLETTGVRNSDYVTAFTCTSPYMDSPLILHLQIPDKQDLAARFLQMDQDEYDGLPKHEPESIPEILERLRSQIGEIFLVGYNPDFQNRFLPQLGLFPSQQALGLPMLDICALSYVIRECRNIWLSGSYIELVEELAQRAAGIKGLSYRKVMSSWDLDLADLRPKTKPAYILNTYERMLRELDTRAGNNAAERALHYMRQAGRQTPESFLLGPAHLDIDEDLLAL